MTKTDRFELRLTETQRADLEKKKKQHGFDHLSDYLIFCGYNARIETTIGPGTITHELMLLAGEYDKGHLTAEEFTRAKELLFNKLSVQYPYNNKK